MTGRGCLALGVSLYQSKQDFIISPLSRIKMRFFFFFLIKANYNTSPFPIMSTIAQIIIKNYSKQKLSQHNIQASSAWCSCNRGNSVQNTLCFRCLLIPAPVIGTWQLCGVYVVCGSQGHSRVSDLWLCEALLELGQTQINTETTRRRNSGFQFP